MTATIGQTDGFQYIECRICGLKSFNPNDIKNLYCGKCGVFHEDFMMLKIWTIYDHPSDYPDKFVARCFLLDKPTDQYLFADSLEELRNKLPPGLHRQNRQPGDDLVIVEVWF